MKLCPLVLAPLGLIALTSLPTPTRKRVGPAAGGGYIVSTGQLIRPAGASVDFPGRPVDLALSPDHCTVYVKDNRGLVVVDAAAWSIRQQLAFPGGAGGSPHGIAVSPDGRTVLATDAGSSLWLAHVAAGGTLAWAGKIDLPGAVPAWQTGGAGSFPCGVGISPDGSHACVALSRNNSLAIVDVQSRRETHEIPVGVDPYGVILSPDGRFAYVSNWGGRRVAPGAHSAISSGTPARVDTRGIADSGSLSIVDLGARREITQVDCGLHPCSLALSKDGSRVYVANENSDTVSVVSVHSRRVLETIPVRPAAKYPFGSMPNAVALGPDGGTLYVAEAGINSVAVVRLTGPGSPRVEGFIPTGWYPCAVWTDGRRLFVGNVKGVGMRTATKGQKGWSVFQFRGSVTRATIPSSALLKRETRAALAAALAPEALREASAGPQRAVTHAVPVPAPGQPSVFRHVIYVIKENRTYDQIFGDLGRGDDDPALCEFGWNVTPNEHRLAEQFALLDNYYCNGVNSADGHCWATEGNCTSYLEKQFGGFNRAYPFGDDPLCYSSSGFIWDDAIQHGVSFRNFGEMDYASPTPKSASWSAVYASLRQRSRPMQFSHNIGIARLRRCSDPIYPGWNLRIPDQARVDRYIQVLNQAERTGKWPAFQIVYLDQDHTAGTSPGMPTPAAMVADNDLALGRLVEAVSRSRFWASTCIFVNEDDPQDGLDHVDGHRSVCLVVSPYTKRGTVINRFYNQDSVLHTIERILGLPPMNQMDAAAPVMSACFSARPDLTPYAAAPNRTPLTTLNPPVTALRGAARRWALASMRQSFAGPDEAEDATMNRILWASTHGAGRPYPSLRRDGGGSLDTMGFFRHDGQDGMR